MRTNTERIREERAVVMALLIKRAPDSEKMQTMAKKLGAEAGFDRLVTLDGEKCILCGLCVQACDSLGTGAISTVDRGTEKRVDTPYSDPSLDCIGCLSWRTSAPRTPSPTPRPTPSDHLEPHLQVGALPLVQPHDGHRGSCCDGGRESARGDTAALRRVPQEGHRRFDGENLSVCVSTWEGCSAPPSPQKLRRRTRLAFPQASRVPFREDHRLEKRISPCLPSPCESDQTIRRPCGSLRTKLADLSPPTRLPPARRTRARRRLRGLGGHVIERLARSGVGAIVAIDCDAFEETNLNRQLLATEDTLGNEQCARSPRAHCAGEPRRLRSGSRLYGQVCTIFPGDAAFPVVYGDSNGESAHLEGVLAPTAACTAAFRASKR